MMGSDIRVLCPTGNANGTGISGHRTEQSWWGRLGSDVSSVVCLGHYPIDICRPTCQDITVNVAEVSLYGEKAALASGAQ